MLRATKADSMKEAGDALLEKAIHPSRWMLPGKRVTLDNRCRVGKVEVCASIDVTPTLETYIRVSFKGPELSPLEAAEFLEQFTSVRYTFIPNLEWLVEIDSREWIHFSRRYTHTRLQA